MSEARSRNSLERLLRRRLLLLIGGLWVAASLVVWTGLRKQTNELLDLILLETAEQLMVMPEEALGNGGSRPRAIEIGNDESDVVYQVYDGHGRLRLRSHAAPITPMTTEQGDGLFENGDWYLFSITHPDGSRRVLIGESQTHRSGSLWDLNAWLIAPLVVLLPLMALVLTGVLRKSFLTLEPMRENLDRRAPHELHAVDVSTAPLELQPMLETVNRMMERVSALVEAERSFAAHTAHELRTPLAAARAQAQRLAVEAHSHGTPQLVERALALMRQLDRLTRLASRLLQLARVDSGVALKRTDVDLRQLAELVSDEFAEARSLGFLLPVETTDGAHEEVSGDIDALGIALRNLIDNALKHGGDQPRVRVCVGHRRLAVQDCGPGIATEELQRLAKPFERGSTMAEGSGLGLTMVQTIARQSGATLRFAALDDKVGGWRFEVSMHFPESVNTPEPGTH
jgi:two-component system, OmpR family, sensor kinase